MADAELVADAGSLGALAYMHTTHSNEHNNATAHDGLRADTAYQRLGAQ